MRQIFYLIMLGHAKVTFVQLVDKSRTNVTMMTGNPAFATPTPPLVDITASADRLDRAIQAYDFSHSRLDKEERDNAFVELKGLRTDLGSYVQSIANGNQAIMTSAGFATRKQPQPMGRLSAPANVRTTVMPKLYTYAGMSFGFYANDHKPIHVHVAYQSIMAKATLHSGFFSGDTVKWKAVRGELPNAKRQQAERLILTKAMDIRTKWEAFFERGESPKPVHIRILRQQ